MNMNKLSFRQSYIHHLNRSWWIDSWWINSWIIACSKMMMSILSNKYSCDINYQPSNIDENGRLFYLVDLRTHFCQQCGNLYMVSDSKVHLELRQCLLCCYYVSITPTYANYTTLLFLMKSVIGSLQISTLADVKEGDL